MDGQPYYQEIRSLQENFSKVRIHARSQGPFPFFHRTSSALHPHHGIIVGLVLLVVAVVSGAVIWKKCSGRGGRDLSFLVSLGKILAQVEDCLPHYWKIPSTHMWNLS